MAYGTVSADIIQSSVPGVSLGAGDATMMKNRIINGAMVIDQRNAGASVATSSGTSVYTLDRWQAGYTQTSKYTVQQNAGSVTPPVGFTNYLGITSSSAYSIGAGDYFFTKQVIEGFNIADLGWGTANAKTVTLSFQVYSSLTGTFGGSLWNNAGNRSYPFTYSILSANTWTQISVTIAGDTTGTWLTNNGYGISIAFGLGVGSTYSGTAGAWAGAFYIGATGATSVVGTNGATFYITGVQLEVGSSATGFEYRNYGQELYNCQRYYQQINAVNSPFSLPGFSGSGNNIFTVWFFQLMRATPTCTWTGSAPLNYLSSAGGGGNSVTISSWPNIQVSQQGFRFYTSSLNGQSGLVCWMDINGYSGQWAISAEL